MNKSIILTITVILTLLFINLFAEDNSANPSRIVDVTMNIGEKAVYFKLEKMPSNVDQYFYLMQDGTTIDKDQLNRLMSLILTAKTNSSKVQVIYNIEGTSPNRFGRLSTQNNMIKILD